MTTSRARTARRPEWLRRRQLAASRARQEAPKRQRDWVPIGALAVASLPGVAALIAVALTSQSIQQTNTQIQQTISQLVQTNLQLQINEQGQITDRYNAAVTNLGSKSIDVRLGGVYALQRIMNDSPRDEHTIVQVLCAFIRNATPATHSPTKSATDLLAALDVVGTRPVTNHDRAKGCDLRYADLAGANLDGADLARTNLTCANLDRASLIGANLRGADLHYTRFKSARLRTTHFAGATAYYTDFRNADLRRSYLQFVDLVTSVVFDGADLQYSHWSARYSPPRGWRTFLNAGTLRLERTKSPPPRQRHAEIGVGELC